jgi:hypothetical protein
MQRKHTILELVQIPRWGANSKEEGNSSNQVDHLHQHTLEDTQDSQRIHMEVPNMGLQREHLLREPQAHRMALSNHNMVAV